MSVPFIVDGTGQGIGSNRNDRLSRDAVERIVRKCAALASEECPAFRSKKIGPYCLRHTVAMVLRHRGIGGTVIAALYLGHGSVATTSIYLLADMKLREKLLERTEPIEKPCGQYRPGDALLAFLESLRICRECSCNLSDIKILGSERGIVRFSAYPWKELRDVCSRAFCPRRRNPGSIGFRTGRPATAAESRRISSGSCFSPDAAGARSSGRVGRKSIATGWSSPTARRAPGSFPSLPPLGACSNAVRAAEACSSSRRREIPAGLTAVTLHSGISFDGNPAPRTLAFRHSRASHAVMNGVPVPLVSRLLDHSDCDRRRIAPISEIARLK